MAIPRSRELQMLATNRWLERSNLVKDKREKEVQEIRWRNSLKPFPPGSVERLQEHKLWEKILPYLTNLSDITSAHDACETFQEIIGEKNETAPLKKVFNLLKEKQLIGREWKEGDGRDANSHLPVFVKQDVMKLRLISKIWKEVAEAVFLNDYVGDWHLDFQEKLGSHFFEWCWFPNVTSFSDRRGKRSNLSAEQLIDKAISVLGNSSPPSVSALITTLHIDDRILDSSEYLRMIQVLNACGSSILKKSETFPKLLQFLDLYGANVQGLLIKCNDGEPMTYRYERLLEVVSRLPNLKALVIDFASVFQPRGVDKIPKKLKEMIKRHPFPTIPSLVLLRFDDLVEECLVSEILEKNVNLKSLKLPNDLPDLYMPILETLNKLKFLEHYVAHRKFEPDLLLNFEWPLRKLSLDAYQRDRIITHLDISILNHFGSTLEHLHLNHFAVGFIHRHKLNLPKLKTLKISHLHNCDRLDFLIPLQALEYLSIGELEDTSRSVLKIFIRASKDVLTEMRNQSSPWRCFTNLKRVELRNREPSA